MAGGRGLEVSKGQERVGAYVNKAPLRVLAAS